LTTAAATEASAAAAGNSGGRRRRSARRRPKNWPPTKVVQEKRGYRLVILFVRAKLIGGLAGEQTNPFDGCWLAQTIISSAGQSFAANKMADWPWRRKVGKSWGEKLACNLAATQNPCANIIGDIVGFGRQSPFFVCQTTGRRGGGTSKAGNHRGDERHQLVNVISSSNMKHIEEREWGKEEKVKGESSRRRTEETPDSQPVEECWVKKQRLEDERHLVVARHFALLLSGSSPTCPPRAGIGQLYINRRWMRAKQQTTLICQS
jgi:hypothetical protein